MKSDEQAAEVEPTSTQAISDEHDLAAGRRGLATMIAGGRTVEAVLGEVSQFAAQAIPGVDGAGVTLIHPVGSTMGIQAWAVTAPFVHDIDVLQYETLQEGPCITCMQTRQPVMSPELGEEERWPRFGPQVARLGVASVLSLPLLLDDQVVGSINAYAHASNVFNDHAVRLGSAFAAPAAVSVYNAQLLIGARDLATQLQRALASRGVIEQAMGIVRARSGGTAEEAFDRLRVISQSENVKLAVVAQRLVDDAVRRAAARRRTS